MQRSLIALVGLLLVGAFAGCVEERSYVRNVYQRDGQLILERCGTPVDVYGHGQAPSQDRCHLEPVGAPPVAATRHWVKTADGKFEVEVEGK